MTFGLRLRNRTEVCHDSFTREWLHSTLPEKDYVKYKTVQLQFQNTVFRGTASKNFLLPGQQLITIERLFFQHYGESLYQSVFHITDHKKRLAFLVDSVIRLTGLNEFGIYMNRLLTLDAIILNEDRHTHNIAVIMNPDGTYDYCPIFDNGAGLLSDTTLDYPTDQATYSLMEKVHAKTFCRDFDEQLNLSEELYGYHLTFNLTEKQLHAFLCEETIYPENIRTRVETVLRAQMRKYQHLFK